MGQRFQYNPFEMSFAERHLLLDVFLDSLSETVCPWDLDDDMRRVLRYLRSREYRRLHRDGDKA